jgi:hypothetical protein
MLLLLLLLLLIFIIIIHSYYYYLFIYFFIGPCTLSLVAIVTKRYLAKASKVKRTFYIKCVHLVD